MAIRTVATRHKPYVMFTSIQLDWYTGCSVMWNFLDVQKIHVIVLPILYQNVFMVFKCDFP